MDNQIGITIEATNSSTGAFTRLKTDLDAVATSAKTVTESQRAMAMQGRVADSREPCAFHCGQIRQYRF